MVIYSHRGNLQGSHDNSENTLDAINSAIKLDFLVEVDLWVICGKLYLSHDLPKYYDDPIEQEELQKLQFHLLVHAKNPEAIEWCVSNGFHFFTHEHDKYALTSFGQIIVYPGMFIPKTSVPNDVIVMLPEQSGPLPDYVTTICTDFPELYV